LSDLFLSPDREALGLGPRWRLYTDSRVGSDVLDMGGPFERAAHGVKEVSGLRWRLGPPLDARDDRLAVD
jgi:hypothetical protein